MKVTTKGQVTIPQRIREKLDMLPKTEVEFEVVGDHALIRKTPRSAGPPTRGQKAVAAIRGTATTRMSTDEIMALTRGWGSQAKSFNDQ